MLLNFAGYLLNSLSKSKGRTKGSIAPTESLLRVAKKEEIGIRASEINSNASVLSILQVMQRHQPKVLNSTSLDSVCITLNQSPHWFLSGYTPFWMMCWRRWEWWNSMECVASSKLASCRVQPNSVPFYGNATFQSEFLWQYCNARWGPENPRLYGCLARWRVFEAKGPKFLDLYKHGLRKMFEDYNYLKWQNGPGIVSWL